MDNDLIRVGIISTKKYHNSRVEAINQTWGKGLLNLLYFTDATEENDNRFLKLTRKNNYKFAYLKTIEGIKHFITKERVSDWYVICDDDTYIIYENLIKFLENKNSDKAVLFGEVSNTWPIDRSLYYCLGGGGYVMSRRAIEQIYTKILENPKLKGYCTDYTDVIVGQICRDKKIELIHSELFHSQKPNHCDYLSQKLENTRNLRNQISFHYLSPKEFLELNKLINVGNDTTGSQNDIF